MRKPWRWTKRVAFVLLLAAAVLCVLSEFRLMSVVLMHRKGAFYAAGCSRHMLIITFGTDVVFQPQRFRGSDGDWSTEANFVASGKNWGPPRGWVPWYTGPENSWDAHEFRIPLIWIPILAVVCTGALLLRRRDTGLCATCRYDLRGLPNNAEVCPECGTKLPARANDPVG